MSRPNDEAIHHHNSCNILAIKTRRFARIMIMVLHKGCRSSNFVIKHIYIYIYNDFQWNH